MRINGNALRYQSEKKSNNERARNVNNEGRHGKGLSSATEPGERQIVTQHRSHSSACRHSQIFRQCVHLLLLESSLHRERFCKRKKLLSMRQESRLKRSHQSWPFTGLDG